MTIRELIIELLEYPVDLPVALTWEGQGIEPDTITTRDSDNVTFLCIDAECGKRYF